MVKDNIREKTHCHDFMGYSFQEAARIFYVHNLIDRIANTTSLLHQLWNWRKSLCTSGSDFDPNNLGARCSSVVRAFAHDVMGHRIDPSWWTH